MHFRGKILSDKSYDPYFKVEFSYETDKVKIEKGYAEIVRTAPRPKITYDAATEEKMNLIDQSKLELELLNLVINYMFNKRGGKYVND